MTFHQTKLDGVYIIEHEPRQDERGYFARIFCQDEFKKAGIDFSLAQASNSFSKKKGTIRGLHFQKEPKAEDKIVQCLKGAIFDVVVDLRQNSPTFGKWIGEELSQDNRKMFFIPKGCAHGFQTLTDDCLVQYFMNQFYSSEHASGVRWDDPFFGITWPIEKPIISPRDTQWPLVTP